MNLCVIHVNHCASELVEKSKHMIPEIWQRKGDTTHETDFFFAKKCFICVEGLKGTKTQSIEWKTVLHTWERVWFPVHSCTTSDQPWGQLGRPPGGSFHLYPPDMLVPVSLQKLWENKTQKISLKIKPRDYLFFFFIISKVKENFQLIINTGLPSLFFSSFGIFFILRSRPLRSVMPYMKAIFSYSSGRAFFRISHTSISGVSSCCFGSLVVP